MRDLAGAFLTIPVLLACAGAATAQAPAGLQPAIVVAEVPQPLRGVANTPIVMVDRLLTFDADSDHRIARDELPERMQGLVARGDRNQDGFLDSDEIRALINASPPERGRVSLFRRESGGLPGVISDLMLAPEKHLRALDIVRAHKIPRNVNDPDSVDLYAAMRELLDDEEYGNFVAAAKRLMTNATVTFRTSVGVVVGGVAGRR